MHFATFMEKHVRAMVDEMVGEVKEIWVVIFGDDTDMNCFTEITKVCLSRGDAAIQFVEEHRKAESSNNEDEEAQKKMAKYVDIYAVDKDGMVDILLAVLNGQRLPDYGFGSRGQPPVYFGENAFTSFSEKTNIAP